MLHLASQTDPEWGRYACDHLEEILVDHAHCEKKAASTAIALMFRYPERGPLLTPLSRLAREELAHFEEVLTHLERLGIPFKKQRPSPYAGRLLEIVRTHEPERILDTLLCCALIEARSCERMQLIAGALERDGDPALAALYRGLLASEARHHHTYVDLARQLDLVPDSVLDGRLSEVALHEADVLRRAPSIPRLHN